MAKPFRDTVGRWGEGPRRNRVLVAASSTLSSTNPRTSGKRQNFFSDPRLPSHREGRKSELSPTVVGMGERVFAAFLPGQEEATEAQAGMTELAVSACPTLTPFSPFSAKLPHLQKAAAQFSRLSIQDQAQGRETRNRGEETFFFLVHGKSGFSIMQGTFLCRCRCRPLHDEDDSSAWSAAAAAASPLTHTPFPPLLPSNSGGA